MSLRFGLIETMLVTDRRIPLWARHEARWARSVEALGIAAGSCGDVPERALALAGDGTMIVRWVTQPAGVFEFSSRAVEQLDRAVRLHAVVVRDPVPEDPPAAHKVTARLRYDAALATARAAGADDALLVSPAGDVLETAVGNLFVLVGGELVTPPLDGRVLPGIGRAWLIEQQRVRERVVSVDEIDRASAVVVTSAVHGPRPAELSGFSAPESGSFAAHLRIAWRRLTSARSSGR